MYMSCPPFWIAKFISIPQRCKLLNFPFPGEKYVKNNNCSTKQEAALGQ